MEVKQFYDKALAHASYAIVSEKEMALVDPARDPQPYLDYAQSKNAKIVAVFETHPHADFASSHLEFHKNLDATIYINSKAGVAYPHHALDHHETVQFGKVTMQTLFTPGHSPDHNAYLLMDELGNPHSIYTGDSLFVGDVGRPDLREGAGHIKATRKDLAKMMYQTVNEIFKSLDDAVVVYPAHGAGSLCGKNMSSDTFSTMGREKADNWAFQVKNEDTFIHELLNDQPFIPKYFPYDVDINRTGVSDFEQSIEAVPRIKTIPETEKNALVVDTRPQELFKKGHMQGAINLMEGGKFETWLGSVIGPEEQFYLVAENEDRLDLMIRKAAKIGYEKNIQGALLNPENAKTTSPLLDLSDFSSHPDRYHIIDIRNKNEYMEDKIFEYSDNIPLPELREKAGEISTEKPLVVHCASGYRSAIGASIIQRKLNGSVPVYDLGEAVKDFIKVKQ